MTTIAVSLLSTTDPKPVQIVVDDVASGKEYAVVGSVGDFTWTVNAGEGESTGEQIVLVDLRAPINTPITYTVTVDGVGTSSTPVTVTVAGDFLLQTLGGIVVIPTNVDDGSFEREYGVRQALFQIPGRPRPVIRHDTLTDGGGSFQITTTKEQSEQLLTVLRSGAPVVYRQTGIRDLPLVEIITVTSLKSTSPIEDLRQWDIGYTLVDNPEPGVASVVFTNADFDEVYESLTNADFDDEWAGLTNADFDAYDWGQRL